MHHGLLALAALVVLAGTLATALQRESAAPATPFDFTKTMRVDYFHGGGPQVGESFSLDRVVNDGAWAGSRTQLVDQTNLGKYLFEVRARASAEILYSRGFASIYGEWETTAEVKTTRRTFHESMRLPWPSGPVTITLRKRQVDNSFADVWSLDVDPAARSVNQAPPARPEPVWTVMENGPAAQKVDILILGEGYTRTQNAKFRGDVTRLLGALFAQEPFKSRKTDFNIRGILLPAVQSGINRPNAGVFRRTPISAEYNVFDSERYVLTLDNRALRDAAAAAPYEFIEILVNDQTYGGGGIFNDQATASVDSAFSDYVFVHEFGHHFAALADEYLHVGRRLPDRRRQSARAMGAERHRVEGSREVEVARPRDPGHANAHALGQGTLRSREPCDPGEAPRHPGPERP